MRQKGLFFGVLAVALMVAGGPASYADILPIDFTATVDGVSTDYELEGIVYENDTFEGSGEIIGAGFTLDWEISGDLDPVVIFALSVTDIGAPSVFGFVFGIPVPVAIPDPTGTAGSISGSITDINGDGASISSAGALPIYTALVNNVPFQTLMDDPFSFSSAVPFASTPIPAASFGVPGLSVPGPPVDETFMSIALNFTTSGGGDVAALTGNFILEPVVVPEPASMTLLGLGLAGMALRSYRRKRSSR